VCRNGRRSCSREYSGAAANFYLWVWALERTSPTRVANTITVNPTSAWILAAIIIGEPIGLNLMLGIAAVACGIWVASTEPGSGRAGDSGSPG